MIYIWRLKKLLDRNSFKQITVNQSTSNDIRKIDPYFKLFEIPGRTAISEHRLSHNGLITVKYKKENNVWIVTDIQYLEQDPSGFALKLQPEDKKLLL